MRTLVRFLIPLALTCLAVAAPRHNVRFGAGMPVELFLGPSETKSQKIEVRGLYVDSKLRDFTTGEPHEVTDRLFTVRKAYRLNDSLPDDAKKIPRWRWQRGGWLLVDRGSGRVTTLNLPKFDAYYSGASWYRDYIAYCGVSDNGEKLYAVVAQIGAKKPVVLKEIGAAHAKEEPESQCTVPKWQRDPMQVTFEPVAAAPVSFLVQGRRADAAAPENPEAAKD